MSASPSDSIDICEKPCALCIGISMPRAAADANPTLRPFCSRCGCFVPVAFAMPESLAAAPAWHCNGAK
jgi:hypothetical protein